MPDDQYDDGPIATDEFDPATTDASTAVVLAVAAAANVPPHELKPLHETADGDALNRLFDDAERAPIAVSFPYQGYVVTVRGRGEVVVADEDASGSPP